MRLDVGRGHLSLGAYGTRTSRGAYLDYLHRVNRYASAFGEARAGMHLDEFEYSIIGGARFDW